MVKARFLDLVLREAAIAAAEHVDLPQSDADLLRRFNASRDHAAFASIVKRHARLVWAVCRQVAVVPDDAEDAFQAVWLALVRDAKSISNANALTAWLHGTAFRICAKVNQTAGRRRVREVRSASTEATSPVSDATWGSLLTVVHEEIARLPASLRTAFVVCELEGVPPGAAAVRLGWKPGTLTGRLCKARQTLMTQLIRRGLTPAGALAGCGIGATTAVAAVPASLMAVAASWPAETSVIPSTIYELAKAATEGTMTKMKLLAAGILIASALGLSGTAGLLAQRPGSENQAQPNGGSSKTPMANPANGPNPGRNLGIETTTAVNLWDYKVEPIPADRLSLMSLLRTRGDEGWEYCGTATFRGPRIVSGAKNRLGAALGDTGGQALATNQAIFDRGQAEGEGYTTELIFKKPRVGKNGKSLGLPSRGNSGRGGPGQIANQTDPTETAGTLSAGEVEIRIVKLKQLKSTEASQILDQLFGGQLTVVADASTNNLILKGTRIDIDTTLAILSRLDESERSVENTGRGIEAQKKP